MTITVDISNSRDLVITRIVSDNPLTDYEIGEILGILSEQFKSEVKNVSSSTVGRGDGVGLTDTTHDGYGDTLKGD